MSDSSSSSSSSSSTASSRGKQLAAFLGGATSGIMTCVLCSPLDVAKVRLQVQAAHGLHKYGQGWNTLSAVRTIVKEEGVAGLYVGIFPTLLTVPLFWSLYWSTYTSFKEVFQEQFPSSPPFVHHVLSAISAGAIGDVVTNPLWVTRTRMQTLIFQARPGTPPPSVTTFGMMSSIYHNEGVGAFYRGLGASFLGLSHVAVQFPICKRVGHTLI
jgi:solute carrier family 25 folate transporter 32